ncbi:MAG: lipopolysaccharide biosynthesis protein [Alteromonadaceae bacterium]|nr:lipopolysaccharide biosynthesis protein [Alteromonadaceae bacterium]
MRDYFSYAPALIIPRVTAAIILVTFARILNPEEMGLYAFIIIVGEYLDTIFCRWIRAGYSRFYFSLATQRRPIEITVLILICPGLAASIIFAFAYAGLDANLDMQWASMLALYVSSNFVLYQGLQYLRVRKERRLYVLIECGRSIFGFGLAFLLTNHIEMNYTWLMIGTQSTTAFAASYLLLRMVKEQQNRRFEKDIILELLRFSAPLLITFFLAGTILVIDRLMLQSLNGPAMLGVYAVSYQLARPAMDVLFNTINVGGYPKLVAAYEAEGDIGAQRILYQKNVAIALVTMPVLFFIVTTSSQIANLLLEDEYRTVAPTIMSLIAISSFIRGWVRFLVDQVFLLKKDTLTQTWNLAPATISIIVASYVLIPIYGVYGAAYSTIIASVIEALFATWRAQNRMKFRVFGREVYIIIISCLVGTTFIIINTMIFNQTGWLCASIVTLIAYSLVVRQFGILKFLRN